MTMRCASDWTPCTDSRFHHFIVVPHDGRAYPDPSGLLHKPLEHNCIVFKHLAFRWFPFPQSLAGHQFRPGGNKQHTRFFHYFQRKHPGRDECSQFVGRDGMVAGQDHLGRHEVFPDAAHILPGNQRLLDLEILVVQEMDVLYHYYCVSIRRHWPTRIDGPRILAYPQANCTIRTRSESGL